MLTDRNFSSLFTNHLEVHSRRYIILRNRRAYSLRTADAFPVVASLPPKNSEPERQNYFRVVKPFVLMLANQIKGLNTARVTPRDLAR